MPSWIIFSSCGQYFWHGVCTAGALCLSSHRMPCNDYKLSHAQSKSELFILLACPCAGQATENFPACWCNMMVGKDIRSILSRPSEKRSAKLASSHVKVLLHEAS